MIVAALCAALIANDTLAAGVTKQEQAFLFDGRSVRVEVFRPRGDAPAPAALVLHGASGVGQGWYVYPFAEALASRGVAAYVVHYYDGLGRRGRKASPKIFRLREKIVAKALDFVASQPDVLADRIGAYGMSLGGFHALALGVQDGRVKSVASLGGAMSRHIPATAIGNMPPTLILHGGRDRVVPLNRALGLKKAMAKAGVDGEIKIYKGEGHSFSRRAHADAIESVARFMANSLAAPNSVAVVGKR